MKRLKEKDELQKLFRGDFYQERIIKGVYFIKSFDGKKWSVRVFEGDEFFEYKKLKKK